MKSVNERIAAAAAAIALLAIPAICVLVVRAAEHHTGPARAGAAVVPSNSPTTLADVDRSAGTGYAAVAAASIEAGFGPDPFERDLLNAADPTIASEEATDQVEPAPDFQVTSVARGGDSAFAVVNGRLSRIGDEVARGWRIVAIDTAGGVVQLRCDESGRTVNAALPRPEDRGNNPRQPGRR